MALWRYLQRNPGSSLLALATAAIVIVLWGPVRCTVPPPEATEDLCQLFDERLSWYRHARLAAENWQVGEPLIMAVIHQESGFHARARPARRQLLRFIPWRRPSTAFGYAQVVDGTWQQYLAESGRDARRDRFADAVDFVGWYLNSLGQQLHLAAGDARSLYLAYHEGAGGFKRRSYRDQPGLLTVADRLALRADRYRGQLEQCRRHLDRRLWLQRLRPFALLGLTVTALVFALLWRRHRS